MDQAKHTPGPWVFFEGGEGGDSSVGVPPEPDVIAHQYNPETKAHVLVATLHSPSYWDRETNSHQKLGTIGGNAALMTAAPELLAYAVCSGALAQFSRQELTLRELKEILTPFGWTHYVDETAWLESLRVAAVAKATGAAT